MLKSMYIVCLDKYIVVEKYIKYGIIIIIIII